MKMTLQTHHPTTTTQTQLPSQGSSDQPMMLLKQQQQQQQPNKTALKQLGCDLIVLSFLYVSGSLKRYHSQIKIGNKEKKTEKKTYQIKVIAQLKNARL